MKKILTYAVVFLNVLSCSKENISSIEEEIQPLVFTAVIDNSADGEASKTLIDAAGKVSWVKGDEITITDANSHVAVYSVSSIDDTGKATFTYKSGSTSLEGSYSAKYGNVNDQWYLGNNGAGCPMTSNTIQAPSTEFTFTNDCGVFNISATATNIIKIAVGNGTNSYALNFATAVSSMTAGTDYYMLAVPGGNSFNQITFVKADGRKYTKTLSSSSFAVEKNHLKKLKFTSADFNKDSNYNGYEYIALSGLFTINSSGTQVRFSKGNLQAEINGNGEPVLWKFAEHQYDYKGEAVANTSIGEEAGTIDLFGWSTAGLTSSGWKQWGINTSEKSGAYAGNFVDWGNILPTTMGATWRTLSGGSGGEWEYLLSKRQVNDGTGEGKSYQRATINKVYGMIIYPDGYTQQSSYSSKRWAELESGGCVFLPAAGYREGSDVINVGSYGCYWSSTDSDGSKAFFMDFDDEYVDLETSENRYCGQSVRLVQEYIDSRKRNHF